MLKKLKYQLANRFRVYRFKNNLCVGTQCEWIWNTILAIFVKHFSWYKLKADEQKNRSQELLIGVLENYWQASSLMSRKRYKCYSSSSISGESLSRVI